MKASVPRDQDGQKRIHESKERGCFDPSRASYPTRVVSVGEIVDLLHVTHAPDRVEEYRHGMARGARFPPISVLPLGRRFFVADGHKRLTAYKSLAAGQIVVEVWPLRRCIAHLAAQFTRQIRRTIALLYRSGFDPRARAEARRLSISIVAHWRRLFRSLLLLRRK